MQKFVARLHLGVLKILPYDLSANSLPISSIVTAAVMQK